MRLENKVAVVTGGGRGIGRVIALTLAKEGADVVVAARTKEDVDRVAEEIRALGRRGVALVSDVMIEEDIIEMIDTTVRSLGKLDILVNNVGLRGPILNVVDMDLKGWNDTLTANLTGTMLCSREALKHMIPRRTGTIISISSDFGKRGIATRAAYVCSKWGQVALTQCLAHEAAEYNVRVNCICPGTVDGPRIDNLVAVESKRLGVSPESYRRGLEEEAAMKRLVTAEEVANGVLFLASDEASGITGQSLNVCGGTVFS